MEAVEMERFYEANAVDGELSPEKTEELLQAALSGGDVDTASAGDKDGGVAPDPAKEETAEPEQPEAPPEEAKEPEPEADEEPVIVARDGRNTIPYSELADAREGLKAAKAANEELAAQMQKLQEEMSVLKGMGVGANPPPGEQPEPENPAVVKLREDWPEVAEAVEGIVGGQRERIKELEALVAQLQPTTEQLAADRAASAHYNAITTAHPDAGDIVNSQAFADWQAAQPGFMRQIFEHVIQQGTTEQVIELLDGFKQANPGWGNSPSPAGQPPQGRGLNGDATASDNAAREAAVQAARAKAGSSAPKSLSDIPGGSAVETDATEALMQMGPGARLDKMLAMAPDKIEEMLRRAV